MKSTIAILLILLFASCGSRKSEVDLQKAQTKRLTEIVLKLQNDIQSNTRLTKVANRFIIEPINPNDSSAFNGTSFRNARIISEDIRTDSTAHVIDKSKVDLTVKEKEETKTKEKAKQTESKKGNIWLYLIIGLVVVFGIGVYARSKRWV